MTPLPTVPSPATTSASRSYASPGAPAGEASTVEPYRQLLSKWFGYSDLRPAQAQVLSALDRGDVFAVSPTGSGKSMSYVLPALLRGRVLVVSPHIALMQDQVESLRANGVNAAFINSTLTNAEKRQAYLDFTGGEIRLLYTSPESLANQRFVDGLAKHRLNLLAIDEAHCVSEWGHTFRPEYLRLKEVRAALGSPRTIALTATATPLARADILQRLGLGESEQIIHSVARDNLQFTVAHAFSNAQKDELLVKFVTARKGSSGIVYVSSRAKTEELAGLLSDRGVDAMPYHAGLDSQRRSSTQRAFMTDQVGVIVATSAFGLGVDKPDVRFVTHFDMPARLEAYYQEAGRAGRDGEIAECLLLYTQWSTRGPEFFIERDHPSDAEVRAFWQELLAQARTGETELEYDASNRAKDRAKERDSSDGRVMAIRALQDSGLIDPDGTALLSSDPAAAIKTEGISQHRQYGLDMLDRMVEFATTRQCRLGVVLKYFGEPDTLRCGRCDNCNEARSSRNGAAQPQRQGRSAARAGSDARSQASGSMRAGDPDRELFDRLRAWRKERAESDSVPAFVVFADRVLVELARMKPTDMVRLTDVPGVGSVKRDRYGRELLRLIIGHKDAG
ncbi:MAG: ATP-dependent DNA helicase [Chloroflexi bacterium]|nr:ATP-dependent DNA helicase [Chloroflexota bacterium]